MKYQETPELKSPEKGEYTHCQELRLYFRGADLVFVEPILPKEFIKPKNPGAKYDVQIVENLCERSVKRIVSVGVAVENPVCTHWEWIYLHGKWVRICTHWE
jgi:hypothetical protein